MKNFLFSILFLLITISVYSQKTIGSDINSSFFDSKKDTINNKKEITVKLDGETKFTDYKVISIAYDTTFIDTTLTLKKDYKFNYLHKDDFELLPFHNQGQTYNTLGFNFENNSIFPEMGISAKRFNYKTVEDISYYSVPTPTTQLLYRSGLEQGQVLDAFITMNMSRQTNVSIAYKGLRSLGKYRNALSSHGNFRATFNYTSKNNKYTARGHFSSFDFYNDENGGLTDASVLLFESGNTNYVDRARLDVNYTNADNMFEGKRYFLDHTYTLFSKNENQKIKNDSLKNSLKKRKGYEANVRRLKIDTLNLAKNQSKIDSLNFLITAIQIDTSDIKKIIYSKEIAIKLGHTLEYETQHYRFNQTSASTTLYGDYYNSEIEDHTSYQKFNNQLYAKFKSPYLGELKGGIRYFDYNYHYNSILYLDNQTISNALKGNAIAFEADWKTNYKNFFITANASTIVSGDITGSSLKASAYIKKDSIFTFKGLAEFTTKNPDLNKVLYQSDYKEYNWQNNFKNEDITSIGFEFTSNKWGNLKGSYNVVDNYTYFNEDALPTQADETLNYFKVTASKAFTVGKFTLDNTVMYQKVSKGESFFNAPELVTRNSFYFADDIFKGDPMYLQTGVTLKYFTKFNARAYSPVLSEFIVQNDEEIGNFPILDFFVNAQIQRTRLFFKVENFTASFTGRKYYAAPNYPYRDLTVRFGLVWNFFI
ncbi:putative porin [Lutibacter sp. TH_r2]|uniref:putative porin n=1 Tax=Lutibacter sp. TH_r2 TaxID=3082083 RepID=UPI00295504E4|nr:putative porin [Lutibacter sp. TH_r2]MDV7187765.1 putative porin [Lutibacter sp. TH_r2]